MDEDIKGGIARKSVHFRASVQRAGGRVAVAKARINVSTLVFSAPAIRAGARRGFIDTPAR